MKQTRLEREIRRYNTAKLALHNAQGAMKAAEEALTTAMFQAGVLAVEVRLQLDSPGPGWVDVGRCLGVTCWHRYEENPHKAETAEAVTE